MQEHTFNLATEITGPVDNFSFKVNECHAKSNLVPHTENTLLSSEAENKLIWQIHSRSDIQSCCLKDKETKHVRK